ncbi:hemolysin family protein [Verrucomicrobiota bacterium]
MILFESIALVACLLGQAFFAGIETGVISIHRMRLRHFVKQGATGARTLEHFLNDSDRLLGTTLVGTNISTVVASVVAASIAVRLSPAYGQILSAVVVAAVVLIFCEYLPKAWFHSRPIERCRRFAGLLRAAEIAFWPISKALIWVTNWLVSRQQTHSFSKPVPFVTKEDLKLLAREGEKDGILSPSERVMIHRVFELSGKTAGEIMIPRAEMKTLRTDTKVSEFCETAGAAQLTRMPVYDRKTDTFIGIVNLMYVLSSGPDCRDKPVTEFIRPPLFIPEDMPVDDIFPRLRHFRQPMALVRDKSDKVVGLVTTEDILEEIVGQL